MIILPSVARRISDIVWGLSRPVTKIFREGGGGGVRTSHNFIRRSSGWKLPFSRHYVMNATCKKYKEFFKQVVVIMSSTLMTLWRSMHVFIFVFQGLHFPGSSFSRVFIFQGLWSSVFFFQTPINFYTKCSIISNSIQGYVIDVKLIHV